MDTLVRHNFARPFQPNSRLTKADAAAVAALIGGLTEPDADDVEQLDRILAAAYSADPAPPGIFTETVQEHGGLAVARAVEASFSLSGRPCQDIVQAAADIAAEAAEEGTWRLGQPIPMDDPAGADPEPDPERPGEEDEPPGEVAPAAQDSQAAGYDFDYADDSEYRGNIDANELTEAERDYRRRAYEAVLHYAADYGMECFPVWWMTSQGVCACRDGYSCMRPGKHPVDGGWPEVATADPEQAARWWRPLEPGEINPVDWRPWSNVGALMGERYFLTDVDTDSGKQGDVSLANLISEHGGEAMPATLEYQTGGGGRGYITLVPEGVEVRGSTGKIAPDIDIKGVRGYGILPPSRSGKGEYRMIADLHPGVLPPTWEADWLREEQRLRTEKITPRPLGGDPRPLPRSGLTKRAQAYITGALASASSSVATSAQGKRNDTLNREAFNLFAKFAPAGLLDIDDITEAMRDAAGACGLFGDAVERTIGSACEGGDKKNRSHELPDFLFEEPGQTPVGGLVLPGIDTAVRAFESLYDLRQSDEGFFARPTEPGTPAVVTEIGDALKYAVEQWWRRAAEAWNAKTKQGKEEATEAFRAELEALDPLVQLEQLKKLYFEKRAKKDADEDDEGKRGEVFPAEDKFTRVLFHLKASATQHEPVELHLRVMDGPGYVVVDLCNETGSVVLITADGWQLCDVREVPGVPWFKRDGAMLPQVIPVQPEDIMETLEAAREVLGVDAAQWAIALAGLIGAYFPSIARPGWWLSGPSGTGKATRGRMLTGWVDPVENLGGRINLKRDPRDARAKASNSFIFTIDNASLITQDESDFWCTMHTGASDQVRKLHSDNTMLSYSYRRIGLGTSLSLPTGFQADALRRMLHIKLAGTDDHPDSETLWQTYNEIKPRVLGAIFTLVAEVLKHLDKALESPLPGVPEMSDFARRLKAADLAFPKMVRATEPGGQDLELYESYRQHAFEVLIAAGLEDPMALLVLKLMDKQGR